MTARSLSTVLGKGTAGPAQADRDEFCSQGCYRPTALTQFIGFQKFGQNVNSIISSNHSLSNSQTMKKQSLWSDAGEQAFISGLLARSSSLK